MSEREGVFLSMKQWPAALAECFRHEQDDGARARSLAGLLRGSAGPARWAACRIGAGVAVLPATAADEASRLLRAHADGRQHDGAAFAAAFSSELGVDGALAVALPAGTSPELAGAVESLLALAAPLVGLHLQAEARRREERDALADAVVVGDAALGLSHELNNHLNTMMLQASVVQMQVDESLGEELAVIRREGSAIAARLRLLQEFRERSRREASPVALDTLLRRAAATVPALDGRVRWELADGLPPVVGSPPALLRLLAGCLRLLAERASDGPVSIGTGRGERTLHVALGPLAGAAPVEHLSDLFAGDGGPPRGRLLHGLAAESLARLVEARWRLARNADNADASDLVLEWPLPR